ncbi:hypothetical protein FJV76_17370 [Mesorhizobium sp. WSM4303]|nr:hypothetical protein FJV77_16655 [Mesorhizobium sp. WSM4306]TRD03052.1 hypothetical protein FJV76_17370 [Mesorhizobium sp. WSM4303]
MIALGVRRAPKLYLIFPIVYAAPHLPAGILSPYSDGERGAVIAGFATRQRCRMEGRTFNPCPAQPAP